MRRIRCLDMRRQVQCMEYVVLMEGVSPQEYFPPLMSSLSSQLDTTYEFETLQQTWRNMTLLNRLDSE